MKLAFVLSLMLCGVVFAEGQAPWKDIRDKINNRIGDGPVDVMLILDGTTSKKSWNKGQRGCKIWTRLVEKMATIGSAEDNSRVGLVQLGQSADDLVQIPLGHYSNLDDNLYAMTHLLEYKDNPLPTTFNEGLTYAKNQFSNTDKKRVIVIASDRKSKENPIVLTTLSTDIKNSGVVIFSAAISDDADKPKLRDISGNSAGNNLFEYFRDWQQYHDRMLKVKDDY